MAKKKTISNALVVSNIEPLLEELSKDNTPKDLILHYIDQCELYKK